MAHKFRTLPDGRVFVPSRGRPPEAPEGYQVDPRNPYMFRPTSPITNKEETDRELYQHLYEDRMLNYGSSKHNRCPGVKFFEFYGDALVSPVFDFGCGRGDTVYFLREQGLMVEGVDQIKLDNGMQVADITQPMILPPATQTALCMDVFEHLTDKDLAGLIANMKQCPFQIISVHNGPAYEIGCKKDLHINKKSFEDWQDFLKGFGLEITRFKQLGKRRAIFFSSV